jgi:hypothetical protein
LQLPLGRALAAGRADGWSVVAAWQWWGAGEELETAGLLAGQRRPRERVVLILAQQMSAQHDELARDSDRRDLRAATRTDALPERA